MRTKYTLTLVVGLALLVAAVNLAAEETEKAPKEAPVELHNQTHCPVMGGKIDSTVYTDIQGQRVYHCCPMCSVKLKADPEKYFKKAAAEGVLFENIQSTCPVSGKELEAKNSYIDYEGRRVYFCCEMCPSKFVAEPSKYLGNLESKAKSEKNESDETLKMGHGDHSGNGR